MRYFIESVYFDRHLVTTDEFRLYGVILPDNVGWMEYELPKSHWKYEQHEETLEDGTIVSTKKPRKIARRYFIEINTLEELSIFREHVLAKQRMSPLHFAVDVDGDVLRIHFYEHKREWDGTALC